MPEPDYIKLEANSDPNEDLLLRVQNVLLEIRATAPAAIRDAIRRGRAATDPVTDSTRLLYYYDRQWRPRRGLGFFYAGCINNPLMALIRHQAAVDHYAQESLVCQLALEIVEEFMTRNWLHQQALKQKAVQRGY
jgi:hypothetical protein